MTKEIRLLTGRHAGARIKFHTTQMRIGNDDEADIQIRDWDPPSMQMRLSDDGALTIGGLSDEHPPIALEDFKPRRFGQVVICAGDADAQWPSDIALLETLLTPTVRASSAPLAATSPAVVQRPRRAAHLIGFVGAVALAAGSASIALPAVMRTHTDDMRPAATPQPTLGALQHALALLHQPDLAVRQQGPRFVVEGVVPDRASEALARNALESIAPNRIDWRIGCVDELARGLQEALNDPALQVRYLGDRAFGVSGIAKNVPATQAVIARMSTDLQPMIERIAQQFEADDAIALPRAIDSLLAVDGLQYVEASDGVKHFMNSNGPRPETN